MGTAQIDRSGLKKFKGHVDFPHVARRKVERETLRPFRGEEL